MAVDPKAKIIATGQDPDHFEEWNEAQLRNPAGSFDFLSTHFVVTTKRTQDPNLSPDLSASANFALPVELGRRFRGMQDQINRHSDFRSKVHLAFTEWLFHPGSADGPPAVSFDNMGGAIAAAGMFQMLMANSDIVPISDMTGIIEFAGIWKKRGHVFGTPSYYTFQMYSTAAGDRLVEVKSNTRKYDVHSGVTRFPEISDVPYLDVVAEVNQAEDEMTAFCINRHLTEDTAATLQLAGFVGEILRKFRRFPPRAFMTPTMKRIQPQSPRLNPLRRLRQMRYV